MLIGVDGELGLILLETGARDIQAIEDRLSSYKDKEIKTRTNLVGSVLRA
jgi:hypothetical protein